MRLSDSVELLSYASVPVAGYDAARTHASLGAYRALIVPVSAARYGDDAVQFQDANIVSHRIYLSRCAAAGGCKMIRHCERWYKVLSRTEQRGLGSGSARKGRAWYNVLNCALQHIDMQEADIGKSLYGDVHD